MTEFPDTTGRPLPSWRAMHADTASWAEEIQLSYFRDAPAWRKLEMSADLTRAVLLLAESGLKDRYPQSSQDEIRRRLADMILGTDLAARVYGPLVAADDNAA